VTTADPNRLIASLVRQDPGHINTRVFGSDPETAVSVDCVLERVMGTAPDS
jgi:hypothetical protein